MNTFYNHWLNIEFFFIFKEKASFCYKQVVSLICVPLKINSTHSTLINHSFALSIFDALSSIAADNILSEGLLIILRIKIR
jgi:hypothetical protein